MKPFLTIAFLLLAAVALLVTRAGFPVPLPMPPSEYDEWARQIAAYAAEQDLEPVDGLFSPYPYSSDSVGSLLKIRDALLPSHAYRKCQLVALPSFDVAWVVYLTRDRGAAPRLVFRRALEPARSATMEAPIGAQGKRADPNGEGAGTAPPPREELDVETYEANLTAETADVLEAVWTRMLERVRFPATPWLGEDGVRFQVSHWSPGRVMSGQTWSPPDGSRPAALVKLSEQMAALARSPSTEGEQRLKSAATALLGRLKSAPMHTPQ